MAIHPKCSFSDPPSASTAQPQHAACVTLHLLSPSPLRTRQQMSPRKGSGDISGHKGFTKWNRLGGVWSGGLLAACQHCRAGVQRLANALQEPFHLEASSRLGHLRVPDWTSMKPHLARGNQTVSLLERVDPIPTSLNDVFLLRTLHLVNISSQISIAVKWSLNKKLSSCLLIALQRRFKARWGARFERRTVTHEVSGGRWHRQTFNSRYLCEFKWCFERIQGYMSTMLEWYLWVVIQKTQAQEEINLIELIEAISTVSKTDGLW